MHAFEAEQRLERDTADPRTRRRQESEHHVVRIHCACVCDVDCVLDQSLLPAVAAHSAAQSMLHSRMRQRNCVAVDAPRGMPSSGQHYNKPINLHLQDNRTVSLKRSIYSSTSTKQKNKRGGVLACTISYSKVE
jgi:hypothetical protein